jgi:transcriptional regulator with XRE-family HTH domain
MGGLINFRVALAAKGMHCLDLAKELGVSPSKLSLVVNGHVEPGPEFEKKCAGLLGVPERWLFSTYRRIPVAQECRTAEMSVAG